MWHKDSHNNTFEEVAGAKSLIAQCEWNQDPLEM